MIPCDADSDDMGWSPRGATGTTSQVALVTPVCTGGANPRKTRGPAQSYLLAAVMPVRIGAAGTVARCVAPGRTSAGGRHELAVREFSMLCGHSFRELIGDVSNATAPVWFGTGREKPGHLAVERHAHPIADAVVPEPTLPWCRHDHTAHHPTAGFCAYGFDQPRFVDGDEHRHGNVLVGQRGTGREQTKCAVSWNWFDRVVDRVDVLSPT